MGYELLLLRVPKGADVEESGEALAVRIEIGQASAPATERARDLSVRLRAALPDLHVTRAETAAGAGEGSPIELRGPADLRLDVSDSFLRVDVPYGLFGDVAEEMFGRVFALLGIASETTGWLAYDPQQAAATALDEVGRSATQELYLSVMDQLYPEGVAERRRDVPRPAGLDRPSGATE